MSLEEVVFWLGLVVAPVLLGALAIRGLSASESTEQ